MPVMQTIKPLGGVPIKVWTNDIEAEAIEQLKNTARLPFIHRHVAAMADTHWGMGATVGSVLATKKAIVPAAVGVDIGCGMNAVKLSIRAEQLPDNLNAVRSALEAAIPHGRTDNGGANDRGAWKDLPESHAQMWFNLRADSRLPVTAIKHPKLFSKHGVDSYGRHLGTLGTGNHFVELCVDKEGWVWLMLHSGSRGIGNRIGTYFIEKAKEEMERWHITLPDSNLAYLPEGTQLFNDYWEALGWAQEFAHWNRKLMLDASLDAVRSVLGLHIGCMDFAINCHHNYATIESHYGENVYVTRKGAVRARKGDLGIIPGSMGARSFIVRGKGNPESFCSCSHGAGRKMSRGAAKKLFTIADLEDQTRGVECRKDADVIDEIPGAYKDIQTVMDNQSDLVEIVAELKQVVCVKG
jgi:tRNA-splicing ligase RtcB